LSETLASLRGRLGAHVRSSRYSGLEVTAVARKTFRDSFLEQVDPDGSLRKTDRAEAERRAEAARKAHYVRLAIASVKARAAKKATP